ncbi:MAG: RDD family protein [Flavobacteriaceae bacterium]|nr:MAG: RDD family protein [Flavobacteriaceae bacterium]
MKKTDYPGVFLRVKAAVIDSIVVIFLMIVATDIFSRFESVPNYARMIAFVFVFILYEPLMVSLFKSTIGHRISKIKVQRFDTGKQLSFGLAIIRFLVKTLLGWLSFFTISINEERKAIHDLMVNSVVVHDNDV